MGGSERREGRKEGRKEGERIGERFGYKKGRRRRRRKKKRFVRGSNPRPSACKADVITTTPTNQLNGGE